MGDSDRPWRAFDGRFGWCPDIADYRDYSLSHKSVVRLLAGIKESRRPRGALPEEVDWREFCGHVEDPDSVGSPAHACVAMIQQLERRATGRLLDLSRLFVHQTAHRLASGGSDSCVSLRTVFKAVVHCGIPPERLWPSRGDFLHRAPDGLAYSFQREFSSLRYVRLDDTEAGPAEILDRVRSFLTAGFPIAFGFPVNSAITNDPEIAFPRSADALVGGQAVTAVGYGDKLRICSDRGALLIRNSWGSAWGDRGYGWLPYSYVTKRLARDFWTLLKPSWLRSGEFVSPVRPRQPRDASRRG
jgi:C1A family cysteine protease